LRFFALGRLSGRLERCFPVVECGMFGGASLLC